MNNVGDAAEAAPGPPSPLRWLRRRTPTTWLLVATGIYFAVSFSLSWLRAVELQTTTWDQGIYQQALWSAAHGRNFYESADLETGGYQSLLQVHTVFLLYLLAPIYAALPYEATLFAVQSLVVGAAAYPLFLLARDLTHSDRLGLVSAIAYLAWTPTLSSNLYDFHAEAFLPLELIVVVLFWERGRFRAGAMAAAVAFATLELAPVLLFFVGLFFALPSADEWQRRRASPGGRLSPSAWVRGARRAWAHPRVRASVALMGACVGVYFLLVYLRVDVLNPVLGIHPIPGGVTGYVIGGTPSGLGLSLGNLAVGFETKIAYWVLLIALLGFVPFLAPRALLLSVPWFGFTLLSSNPNYVELGFQYGFIAAGPMLVAFVYGLPRAQILVRALRAHVNQDGSSGSTPALSGLRRRRTWRLQRAYVAGFVLLVALNIALSPVNPLVQNQGGLGSAYHLTYSPTPGFGNVEQLVGQIPPEATVLASDVVFPLVANDQNAYTLFWTQNNLLDLPFNSTHLPPYVLLASERTNAVPAWLEAELYNASDFGIRGVAWTSGAGPVLLFEAGFTGPATTYGGSPTFPVVVPGTSIVDSDAGFVTTAPGTDGPDVVASAPGVLGTVFYGPGASLPAGNYRVTLLVNASASPGAPRPVASEPTLWIGASAFAQPPYYGWSLPFSAFSPHNWTNVNFTISLPGPTIQFVVQGVILNTNVQAYLESVEIVPTPG